MPNKLYLNSVFHDNPYAGPSTSLLSDEDEDVTTSPSLTFGVEPRIPSVVPSSGRGRGGHKADYRALQRNNSRSNETGPDIALGTVHQIFTIFI